MNTPAIRRIGRLFGKDQNLVLIAKAADVYLAKVVANSEVRVIKKVENSHVARRENKYLHDSISKYKITKGEVGCNNLYGGKLHSSLVVETGSGKFVINRSSGLFVDS